METSSHTLATAPAVIGGEDEPTYRTVSVLAIVSLLLGLAAPLCFAAPLLFAIPLFGIGVALVALARIATSDGTLIGRAAATIGLALCVASLAGAASRSYVSAAMLSHQARDVGLEWLTRLQSHDAEAAFRMTNDSMRRESPPDPGEPERPKVDYFQVFRAQPVVAFMLEHGSHTTVRFDRDLGPGSGPLRAHRLEQRYTISDEHADEPITVVVSLQRALLDGQLRWIIVGYQSDDLPDASGDAHSHSHAHAHGHDHSH